jgi:hypothetical protein
LEHEKYNERPTVVGVGKVVLYDLEKDTIISSKEIYDKQGNPIILSGQYNAFQLFKPSGEYFYLVTDERILKYDRNINLIWESDGSFNNSDFSILQDQMIYFSRSNSPMCFDESGDLVPFNSTIVEIRNNYAFSNHSIRYLNTFRSDMIKVSFKNDGRELVFQK